MAHMYLEQYSSAWPKTFKSGVHILLLACEIHRLALLYTGNYTKRRCLSYILLTMQQPLHIP